MKTLKNFLRNEKENVFKKFSSVQDIVAIDTILSDNIFKIGKNKYSKTYRFSDVNYLTLSEEDKKKIHSEYSKIINSFDSSSTTKITLYNRKVSGNTYNTTHNVQETESQLDKYRKERLDMISGNKSDVTSMNQERYITVSTCRNNLNEVKNYFSRLDSELYANFRRLNSELRELDTESRLKLIYDFFHPERDDFFHFDLHESMQRGHHFKDVVVPESFEGTKRDYFKFDGNYGRALVLRDYPNEINDTIISDFLSIDTNTMLSIDLFPVPMSEAVKEAENRVLGIETNISSWQRRQNKNNNFSATVPYDLEQQKNEARKFLDSLVTKDQRMILATITVVIISDSKENLDKYTDSLLSIASKNSCRLSVLSYQQIEGLNTVLPYGHMKIQSVRTLTTEGIATFIPFKVKDVCENKGVYYGKNTISKNPIVVNRMNLLNGNAFILGVSGGGKSFAAKNEIVDLILSTDSDVIIIDPEKEYTYLTEALGGQVIKISPTSPNHINALDLNANYGEKDDPIAFKSDFILSMCEQIMGRSNLSGKEKSIIDRVVKNIYRPYRNNYIGSMPTLDDLRKDLLKQSEDESKEIALALELFASGSLNTFSKQTNVNTTNRLICYDILDMGEQLMQVGMLIILDNIWNRITTNRNKGKNTFIFIDEIYLLFQNKCSANFLYKLWKRARKYGAFATGITQNVDELLESLTARTMLANSEFVVMLNQASTDRGELAKLLNISDSQLQFITNATAGSGLIRIGNSIIPFTNEFPHNSLYNLMTTKPGEMQR